MVAVRATGKSRLQAGNILQWDELLRVPPPEYLWGELVRLRAVNIFQGWPQSAKSFVMLHLALAVAAGKTEFMGQPIHEQMDVTYMALEDLEADAQRARDSGYEDNYGFHVYAGMLSLTHEARPNIQEAFFALLDEVSPGGLIAIDSFSAGSGVDSENDSADVQNVYNLFFEAARRGYTVIVITHISKKADPFDVNATRGSSAAAGAASSIIGFRDWGGNHFELSQAKNRTASGRGSIHFELSDRGPDRVEAPTDPRIAPRMKPIVNVPGKR